MFSLAIDRGYSNPRAEDFAQYMVVRRLEEDRAYFDSVWAFSGFEKSKNERIRREIPTGEIDELTREANADVPLLALSKLNHFDHAICSLMGKGFTSREIAEIFNCTELTIKKRLTNAYSQKD